MSLKQEIINSIDRFRTISINHPVGFIWKDNMMTFYQLGKKWTISKVFKSCYKPKKVKGIILPRDIKNLLVIGNELQNSTEEVIIVPKELGFDLLKPNDSGNPLLMEELRFFSIRNKLVLFSMRFLPEFSSLMKTLNKEYK